jgi:hypothetical protein
MVTPRGEPVTVTLAANDAHYPHDPHGQRPTSFTWRGRRSWVCVLTSWRLCRRWRSTMPEPSTRTYFCVLCTDQQQLFELAHDHASDRWVLDAVAD